MTQVWWSVFFFQFLVARVDMSEDMVTDGYQDIVNVDISTAAIDMMKKKHEHIFQLKWILQKYKIITSVMSTYCKFFEFFKENRLKKSNGFTI